MRVKCFVDVCFLTAVLLTGGLMTSCSASDSSVYGGDAVYYSYCVYGDHSELATIPVITKSAVKEASLNSVVTDSTDSSFAFTEFAFDLSETFQYKGYNIYFLVLEIQNTNTEKIVTEQVNNINLNLNQQIVTVPVHNFRITNGVEGVPSNHYTADYLHYGGAGYTILMNTVIPSEKTPEEIGILADDDLTIDSLIISDYFRIEQLLVDGQKTDPADIQKQLTKDTASTLSLQLAYNGGSSERGIVRTSRIITYTRNQEKYAFIEGAGEYLYLGQESQQALKNYIDQL